MHGERCSCWRCRHERGDPPRPRGPGLGLRRHIDIRINDADFLSLREALLRNGMPLTQGVRHIIREWVREHGGRYAS